MEMKSAQASRNLGEGSVAKLLFKLAVPTMLAQLVNVLYSVVDRMYIGNMQDASSFALAGLGASLPIIMIVSAFAALIGMGSAPRVAIKLGENKKDDAEGILGNAVVCLIFLSVLLTTFFLIFLEPLLLAFGATTNSLPFAIEYLSIYIGGSIFVLLALGLNPFINAQGKAAIAMISVLIGAVFNIVLDPIFIFVFDMGISGAAVATVISQAISAIWIVWFLLSKKSGVRIKKSNFKIQKQIVLPILALGLASFVMQSTESLVQITFNKGMKLYGGADADVYLAAMTILMSVMQMCVMPLNGLSQGAQPLISYNFGAMKMDRVKKAFKLLFVICLTSSFVLFGLCLIFPLIFIRPFTSDQATIEITIKAMRVFFVGMMVFGAQISCQTTFLAFGEAKKSLFLAMLRKIILLIPLALLLPTFSGIDGVFWAEPIADLIAVSVTVTLFFLSYKKIVSKRLSTVEAKSVEGATKNEKTGDSN